MKALNRISLSKNFISYNFLKNSRFLFSTVKDDGVVNLSNNEDFDSLIKNSQVPVMVDFYADWCGPCKMLTPKLIEKQKELNTFKLVKVNVDSHQELAEKFDVQGIPHVLLFKNGQKVSEFVGMNPDSLTKMIKLI
jgi:thioredoxin 1